MHVLREHARHPKVFEHDVYGDPVQLSFEALNTMQHFLNQIGKVIWLPACRSCWSVASLVGT